MKSDNYGILLGSVDDYVDPFYGHIHMSPKHVKTYIEDSGYSNQGQMIITIEECSELQKALTKSLRSCDFYIEDDFNRKSVIEEIAHVLISIKVLCASANINPGDIMNEIFKKCPDSYDLDTAIINGKQMYVEVDVEEG